MILILASNQQQAELAAKSKNLSRNDWKRIAKREDLMGVHGAKIIQCEPILDGFPWDLWDDYCMISNSCSVEVIRT